MARLEAISTIPARRHHYSSGRTARLVKLSASMRPTLTLPQTQYLEALMLLLFALRQQISSTRSKREFLPLSRLLVPNVRVSRRVDV